MNPAWRIDPLKVEVLSWDPLLFRFYDVISKVDAEKLQEVAEPNVVHSIVAIGGDGKEWSAKVDTARSSFSTRLHNSACPECVKISRKIERITGLVVNERSAEPLKILSYTIGGAFLVHHDSVPKYYQRNSSTDFLLYISQAAFSGYRLATFMIYVRLKCNVESFSGYIFNLSQLSDVEAGGSTVFPNLGISVKPVSGSAIFWYNLDVNKFPNMDMVHGACPVILGGPKWGKHSYVV